MALLSLPSVHLVGAWSEKTTEGAKLSRERLGARSEQTFSCLSTPRFSRICLSWAIFCAAPHLAKRLKEANCSPYLLSVCPSQYSLTAEDGVDLLERTDVHIHFPAGAVGKDGPSAGVTIVTVLVSLFRYIYLLHSFGKTLIGRPSYSLKNLKYFSFYISVSCLWLDYRTQSVFYFFFPVAGALGLTQPWLVK